MTLLFLKEKRNKSERKEENYFSRNGNVGHYYGELPMPWELTARK